MKFKKMITKWNPLDVLFYKLDTVLDSFRASVSHEDTAVETIIAAETSHLRQENEQLKKLSYPKRAEKTQIGSYRCPNKRCGIEIDKELIEKYQTKFCPECGQRIFI